MPILDHLLSILAPHACLLCGREGSLLCKWCKPEAFPELSSHCFRCQRLTQDFATCPACCRETMVQRVWAATSYAATAKQLLHLYKFEHVQAAFGTIAEAMDEALPLLPPEIVVVPLPTATSRVRQRGYDHARLLARTIAAKRQLLYLPILHRLTQTRQVGATRQQRLGQLQGAFWVSRTKLLGGHSVLLIDDVATTGASLTHAAQSLMQAGAQTVEALVFAQRQ